jgi:hypothetical protein
MRKKIGTAIVFILLVFFAVSYFSTTAYADAPAATDLVATPGAGSAAISGRVNAAALAYLKANPSQVMFIEIIHTRLVSNDEYDYLIQPKADGTFAVTVKGLPINDYKFWITIADYTSNGVHDNDVLLSAATLFSVGAVGADPGNVVETPVITPVDGGAKVTIRGTVSNKELDKWFSSTVVRDPATLVLLYGNYLGDPTLPNGAPIKAACSGIGYDNSFACFLKDIQPGQYYFRVVIDGSNGLLTEKQLMTDIPDRAQGLFSGAHIFFVNKTDLSSTPTFNLGTVNVTESKDSALVTVGVGSVNTLPNSLYAIEIGLAVAPSVGSTYICTGTNPRTVSSPIKGDAGDALVATFTLSTPGSYCIGLRQLSSLTDTVGSPVPVEGGASYFKDTVGAAVNGIFSILGATLAPGATLDHAANATGCVTKDDNSNYCLLAPLPGMGDATGNLDVKNFGDYIGIIIKIVFGLIGVLSVLMIVIGGIEYMSTVSIGEKEGAKSRITSALMGLLLALASYIILNTLNPDLVSLGVHIPSVTVPLEENFVPTSGGGQATGGGVDSNVNEKISTYDVMLAASSQKYGVECTLMKALMYAESGGKLDATSNVGAKGLIQLMPATFKDQGFNDPTLITDPASNIDAASSYIGKLEKKGCNGAASNNVCNVNDWKYVIAAYNGGPGANSYSDVCKKGQGVDTTAWQCTLNVKGYTQTRNYVQKVMNNYNKLKANADKGWAC